MNQRNMNQRNRVGHRAIVRAYIQDASYRGLRHDTLDELVAPWTGEAGQRAFYRQIADYDERFLHGNEQRLAGIQMPVRIVWGQEDGWVPTDLAKRLEGLIPGATLSLVPGSGHLIQYDAPAALMNEIRAWLDTRRSG